MLHVAITSYIPPGPPNWPESGFVEWVHVTAGIPASSLQKILALPCKHPRHVLWQSHAHWVVLEIDPMDFEEAEGFVQFRRGRVLFKGSPRDSHAFLRKHGLPAPHSIAPVQVGQDWEDVSLGEYGIAIAGWDALASTGDCGVASASNLQAVAGSYGAALSTFGDVQAGDYACAWTSFGLKAAAGRHGVSRSDEFGRSEVQDAGVAITREWGTAIAGDSGVAIAGRCGSAHAGKCGVAFANSPGKVRAGEGGVLLIRWSDQVRVARVGVLGIQPEAWYTLNESGEFIECDPPPEGNHGLP